MKVYLAAIYSSKAVTKSYAEFLQMDGHEITSQWLDLPNGYDVNDVTRHAEICLNDIDRADVVVLFTLPFGTMFTSGGRMVEFGYAVAKAKPLIVVGERENIFCHLPQIHNVLNIDKAAELLNQWQRDLNLELTTNSAP